jgi:hypothetical protein
MSLAFVVSACAVASAMARGASRINYQVQSSVFIAIAARISIAPAGRSEKSQFQREYVFVGRLSLLEGLRHLLHF